MKKQNYYCCVCRLDGKPKAYNHACVKIKLNKPLVKFLEIPFKNQGCGTCLNYMNEQYFKATKNSLK